MILEGFRDTIYNLEFAAHYSIKQVFLRDDHSSNLQQEKN